MAIKYLYIDDSQERYGIARGLSTFPENLLVQAQKPEDWSAILKDLIIPKIDDFDGLLLDWQLQQEAEGGDYSSSALAQQIRELVNQGTLPKDIPIVLCSAQAEFDEKFGRDKTSHDLFDLFYKKDSLTSSEDENSVSGELISMSSAYKTLNQHREYLGIDYENLGKLDIRFQQKIDALENSPPHEKARFIKKELIDFQGILINEDVLAARLGVSISKSEEWDSLKELFADTQYHGILGDAWPRWWWFKVDNWWNTLAAGINLQLTGAEDRVSILKEKTQLLKLEAAQMTKYSSSNEFWTVCHFTKKPIDIYDGFLLNERTNFPWQEKKIVSNEAVLSGEFSFEVDILDKERLNQFKESYR